MPMPDVSSLDIRRLNEAEAAAGRNDLIDLLADSIEDGASVGFVLPLAGGELSAYWLEVEAAIRKGNRHLLAARADGRIVGAVQLDCAVKTNARHRAEVQKLLVHRRARRRVVSAGG